MVKKVIIHYMMKNKTIILISIVLNLQMVIILIMKLLYINYAIHLVKHVKYQVMKQNIIVKHVYNGYNFEIRIGIYKNCYMNCSFYHYYDSGISYCTKNNECPKEYDKLIDDKNECVSNCSKDGEYKFEFRKNCYKKCP